MPSKGGRRSDGDVVRPVESVVRAALSSDPPEPAPATPNP
jgi:hypothetical protein